ncbi:hypothetical protein [Francisella sp. LA112445]|uniref:hypothetical protein n=1 Tax=Francisella sp. LA112445 TaxID=1395624 RepID=UPI001788BDCE|nr:hypothetical protein [Francisella sp. LA112445]QIW10945.1 hypothetical protein FIP56_09650 [Francisella sp. LA112445]
MRNLLALLLVVFMLTSCSTYNGPTFKGSDYISTDVGTTYHYKRVELKTKKSISIDITVDSCNSNKSKCSYTTKIFDSSGKMISKYSMHYTINKGSFFIKGSVRVSDNFYKDSSILLPEKLQLKHEVDMQHPERYGDVRERLIVHQEVPSIKINNHKYENCLNIISETVTPLNDKKIKILTNEIDCKNIGAVRKEMSIYSLIPVKNPEYNNFALNGSYIETLQSITHKDS